ncbi:sugar kinase [Erythrobacter aureus]|uniref:Sugar kinase n=1 Tax=Erythrobacter aureus TaxID=2182384 RepID=A0A345YIC5_9SPHN|nr:sugar kinase [Erythrobacter aureus]AXK43677.1 sugar kinase [Erythrobacter aureus]
MFELAVRPAGGWELGHGGDTLNTALHMARMGLNVAFASALGGDAFSDGLRKAWTEEGLDLSMVLCDPSRSTGLYAISVDEAGERSFTYWRSNSAARQMFALPDSRKIIECAVQSDLLVFSLISLAILPRRGRDALIALAHEVRELGGMVAFDGNYRPRLWQSPTEALSVRDAAIATATIGLPTLEDEIALSSGVTAESVASHWLALGCREVIVKLGKAGCRMPDGSIVTPGIALDPVDTSGAGDAFNAGYLAARLRGCSGVDAAQQGHALAGWTIMRRGAIPPRDAHAPYA